MNVVNLITPWSFNSKPSINAYMAKVIMDYPIIESCKVITNFTNNVDPIEVRIVCNDIVLAQIQSNPIYQILTEGLI